MRFRVLLLLCALSAISLLASPSIRLQNGPPQKSTPQQPPGQAGTIRVVSSLVLVPVSVSDSAGQAVKSLKIDDFVVEENGTPVVIDHLGEPEATRLEMVLAFDITGSVRPNFAFEQHAATSFLKAIFRPGDGAAILCIDAQPQILLDRTTSLAAALDSLDKITPSGSSTAFFDSVIAAAQLLQGPVDPHTRRVQIVLSDGEDNFSQRKLADALREVQQADCIFYSINPGGASIRLNTVSLRGQQGMEALAAETGGVAFIAAKPEELADIYGRIAAELQAQYLLSYYSPNPKADGSFRSIVVRVPKHPELRIRSRQGYYTAKSPLTQRKSMAGNRPRSDALSPPRH